MKQSLWESKWFFNYDTTIIGSGIIGLSTAAAILEEDPSHKILILERGLLPSGASVRNAGLASFGNFTEILDDISLLGEKAWLEMTKMRVQSLQKLRKRLGENNLDFKQQGGYEIIGQEGLSKLSQLDYVNNLLRSIFNEDVFCIRNEMIEEFGFNRDKVKALIFNKFEGQIDSGRAMTYLLQYVQNLGAYIINGADVIDYKSSQNEVTVNVKDPLVKGGIQQFKSKKLVLCTNAYSETFIKDMDFYPGRGQVIVTSPIKDLKLKGAFHYDGGYYYFRDYYGRILLGGGRNLDFKGETTTEAKTTEKIISNLKKLLKEVIIPNQEFTIDYEWAGIMCFGKNSKGPIVTKVEDNVYAAIRMSGMGVSLASQVADMMKALVLSPQRKEGAITPKL